MQHQIKAIAEAITHHKTSHLVVSHVKELMFQDKHLTIFVDNAGPLHELCSKEMDEHLRKGLEKVYGDDITYELKLTRHAPQDGRQKKIPHSEREFQNKNRR